MFACEQCRIARSTYSGDLKGVVALQYDEKTIIRENVSFGSMPIMLKVRLLL